MWRPELFANEGRGCCFAEPFQDARYTSLGSVMTGNGCGEGVVRERQIAFACGKNL